MANCPQIRLARTLPALLLLGAPLVACRSVATTSDAASLHHAGDFERALQAAEKAAQANPNDAHLADEVERARLALILDRGRRALFGGDAEYALELFQHARQLAPEDRIAGVWEAKSRRELASGLLERATELTQAGDLDGAEAAYEQVLVYVPDDAAAQTGLTRVLFTKSYRGGQSKTYFDEGVATYRRYFLEQAQRAFGISIDYDPANERAAERRAEVARLLIEQRLDQAVALEQQGFWAAARNEYRLILLVDPSDPVARDGIDRMDREARAQRALSAADMDVRKGLIEEAEAKVAEAAELTAQQVDVVAQTAEEIRRAELQALFDLANALEEDLRYPEAVEAYAKLLEAEPDWPDAAQNRKTLEEFIALATEHYAKAQEATTDAEKTYHLRQIQVFWPGYRDSAEQLARLQQGG
jgi:tetratricopeptide (TPR) repeat protein